MVGLVELGRCIVEMENEVFLRPRGTVIWWTLRNYYVRSSALSCTPRERTAFILPNTKPCGLFRKAHEIKTFSNLGLSIREMMKKDWVE